MDWISQLPEPILQHILFFLPAQDAVRMSILSKNWRSVWASLPVFKFDFDETTFGENLLSSKRQQKKEELVKFVDDSLARLRQHKAIINKFRLCMTLTDLDRIDHWIGLATRNYIKEFDLDIQIGEHNGWYSLPKTTFAAQSLVLLKLTGCKLEKHAIVDGIKFTCLKELFFLKVYLDKEIISKLILSCPSLENFTMKYCLGVTNLCIYDLPKLKKLVLFHGNELGIFERVEVEALNLQTLHYRGRNRPMEIDVAPFKYLKELSIIFCEITDILFGDIISALPLLESLSLRYCSKLERVKISSHLLKSLWLSIFEGLLEAEIDTPNLLLFGYGGETIPPIFSKNILNLHEAYLEVVTRYHLDTLWFLKLREYMGKFNQLNSFHLRITSGLLLLPQQITFVREELSQYAVPPLSVLKQLKLEIMELPLGYEMLLDGLLWSCHPETLSVSGWGCNNEFIRFLLEELIDRPEVPLCCSSCCIECWRHYIKDIELESFSGMEDRNPDQHHAFLRSLLTLEPGQEIHFKLKW